MFFLFIFLFKDDWITPTEIAVTQILGHLPNPLWENIQITPLFSSIHSGLLFLILWLQWLTVLLIVDNLQQFCLIYLCLLCYGLKKKFVDKSNCLRVVTSFTTCPDAY